MSTQKEKIKLIVELDDFHSHPEVDCLDFAAQKVLEWPSLILNFFSPALYNYWQIDSEWARKVKGLVDDGNFTLNYHGCFHTQEEFKDKNKDQAIYAIQQATKEFDRVDLPVLNVFRGPHWGINSEVMDALGEIGITHLYIHPDQKQLFESKTRSSKAVYYNWNLADEFNEELLNQDLIVAHFHTHNVCNNGIEEAWPRFVKFLLKYYEKIEFLRTDEA